VRVEHLVGQLGEQQLADRGAMQRHGAAGLEAQPQRPLRLDAVDVDHVASRHDAQVARLARLSRELGEDGVAGPRAGRGAQHVEAERHESLALDDAAPPRLAADEAQALEDADDAVRGGLWQVEGGGDLGDRQRALARGDHLQHAKRLRDCARGIVA
jgi:hypothetical protein